MKKLVMVLPLMAPLASGCVSGLSGHAYPRSQVQVAQSVRFGTIESVQDCQIEGTKSPVGTLAGAAIGGIGGSTIGGGKGKAAAAIGGALLGGLIGSAAEEATTRKAGLELTVVFDEGDRISVVQAAEESFTAGDRVRVLTQHGITRVTH